MANGLYVGAEGAAEGTFSVIGAGLGKELVCAEVPKRGGAGVGAEVVGTEGAPTVQGAVFGVEVAGTEGAPNTVDVVFDAKGIGAEGAPKTNAVALGAGAVGAKEASDPHPGVAFDVEVVGAKGLTAGFGAKGLKDGFAAKGGGGGTFGKYQDQFDRLPCLILFDKFRIRNITYCRFDSWHATLDK